MNKLKFLVVGLIPLFSLCSCEYIDTNIDESDTEENIDFVEGGPGSLIACEYYFNSFSEYLDFYNVFKLYNSERYWLPIDSNDFITKYRFESLGVPLEDVHATRYDLEFPLQTMEVSLSIDTLSINLEINNINIEQIEGITNLIFEIDDDNLGLDYYNAINLMCDDILIAYGNISFDISSNDELNTEILDEIILLFNDGFKYVF